MNKKQRKLATARLLCDELKEQIRQLEKQLDDKGRFNLTASGRANTNRLRIQINKLIIEATKND